MKRKKIVAALCALAIVFGSSGGLPISGLRLFDTAVTASAECYQTVSGNSTNITYSTEDGHVLSVVTNFTFVDSGDIANNPGTRYYNMIFTTDISKTSISTSWRGDQNWSNIASEIGSDSIYNNNNSGSSNVRYDRITNAEANALTNTTVIHNNSTEYNTKVSGTYTITDSAILNQFEDGVTYYGLLCSSTGSGVWYTGVYSEVVYHSIEPDPTYNVIYDGNGSTGGTVPTDTKDYLSAESATRGTL